MDVWFSNRRGTTAERHERELKHLRILCTRFSEARRESFCPLDTDLSWMSTRRKLWLVRLGSGSTSSEATMVRPESAAGISPCPKREGGKSRARPAKLKPVPK